MDDGQFAELSCDNDFVTARMARTIGHPPAVVWRAR